MINKIRMFLANVITSIGFILVAMVIFPLGFLISIIEPKTEEKDKFENGYGKIF